MKTSSFSRYSFEILMSILVFGLLSLFTFSGQADAAVVVTSDSSAFAADLMAGDECMDGVNCNPDIRETIKTFVNYFLGFLGLLAVIMIIYAGFLMVLAQGEEDSVEKGKKIIIWAFWGIIIILLSYAIVNFVIQVGSE